MVEAITTRSPICRLRTSSPRASTMPTPSWPRMVPGCMPAMVPRTMCRSVPQMADAVMRTMASVGACRVDSGTSSRRMSPTSWKTTAFMIQPPGPEGPSVRLGDTLQHGVAGAAAADGGDVAQGHHTHQALLAIEHRQPADLDVGHVLGHMLDVLVLEAVADVGGHHLAHRGVRPQAPGQATDDHVAVGEHAHQTIALVDQQGAGVDALHQGGGFPHALFGQDDLDVAGHDFGNLHGGFLRVNGTNALAGPRVPCARRSARRQLPPPYVSD